MKTLDHLNKYYKLYMFFGALLLSAITYLVYLELRIPNDAEEMSEIREVVEKLPVLVKSIEFDSIDHAHASEIRQMRFDNQVTRDSVKDENKRIHDSLTIDAFKRFTVQIEQMNEKIDNIHN